MQAQVVRKSGFVRALWCVCLASTSLAASLPNYITRLWTMDDGLPGSSVMNVIQSHDGYLWVGTYSGLARFDGVHFTVFDNGNAPEMPSPHVTCLFEDAEGAIWIGHQTGELTRYQNGKFRAVPVKAACRAAFVPRHWAVLPDRPPCKGADPKKNMAIAERLPSAAVMSRAVRRPD